MIRGSSWRSEPAAKLRGLANSGSPAAARAAFSARNCRALHVHLAAYLQRCGHPGAAHALRDVADRAQVGGDVLADGAVAARGALDEKAVLVAQAGRQAVDLGLGDQGERHVLREVQEAPHALQELAHLGRGHGIVERQHGYAVADLAEVLDRRGADPMRRAVGADQIRKARLDRLIALTQRVILGVGDLRGGVAVVQPVVMRDLRREARELGRRLLAAQPLDRHVAAHQADARIRLSAAARAASVIRAPASMRAISSRRSPSDSRVTETAARPARTAFSTRQ